MRTILAILAAALIALVTSAAATPEQMDEGLYLYAADIKSAYAFDGDTITIDIDLGLNIWLRKQKLRLVGIDTPELKGESRLEGLAARDYARALIASASKCWVRTEKDKTGKFGRWLATIYLQTTGPEPEIINLNAALLTAGHAKEYRP